MRVHELFLLLQVCMEPLIGQLYRENNALFQEIAAKWTRMYAMHHLRHVMPAVSASPGRGPRLH